MSFFSDKIRKLRLEAGLTQKVLAEEIGISQGNYSALENGKFEPSLKTLVELSNFYNVWVDELLMSTKVFVRPLTEEAEFIGKKYDMLTSHDQIEIKTLINLKMKWYNEQRIQDINDGIYDEDLEAEDKRDAEDLKELDF